MVDHIIDLSDLLPTLCDVAGVGVPEGIDGRSFSALWTDEPYAPRASIYIWFSRSGKSAEAQAFARDARYKLYEDGRFFDVARDRMEQNPLPEIGWTPKQRESHGALRRRIAEFADVRPPNGE